MATGALRRKKANDNGEKRLPVARANMRPLVRALAGVL